MMGKKRKTYVAPRRWWNVWKRKPALLWVASDGSWGMSDFYVVNVNGWSDEDWDYFEDASDNDRINVAIKIGGKL